MFGCGLQWYGNEPAVEKVREYESPGSSSGESHTPPSDVDVCPGTPEFSQLIHQTVVPADAEIDAGSKAKLRMRTTRAFAGGDGALLAQLT